MTGVRGDAANLDDLDPRLLPGVLDRLLLQGAADAWLVPIVMKKGRPAHVLTVLCRPQRAAALRDVILTQTSTLGVRSTAVTRLALFRGWTTVAVDGHPVRIKIGHDTAAVRQVNPEFDDVARVAQATGRPEREVRRRVPVGTSVTLRRGAVGLLGDRIAAPAMDDRAGLTVLLRTLEHLRDAKIELREIFDGRETRIGGRSSGSGFFKTSRPSGPTLPISLAPGSLAGS